ncbi:MAG TPA: hypothetical protein VGW34_06600 [Allosphingosinicella sp.]|nr:hypothetical protein [Allosphingosinicella sp.]
MRIALSLAAALSFALAACSTVSGRMPDRIPIAQYGAASGTVTALNRRALRSTFTDGVPIREVKVQRVEAAYYLHLRGAPIGTPGTAQASCRTVRMQLQDDKNGNLALGKEVITESCRGVGCQICDFGKAPLGGCVCNEQDSDFNIPRATGICEHTKTKTTTTDFIRTDLDVRDLGSWEVGPEDRVAVDRD